MKVHSLFILLIITSKLAFAGDYSVSDVKVAGIVDVIKTDLNNNSLLDTFIVAKKITLDHAGGNKQNTKTVKRYIVKTGFSGLKCKQENDDYQLLVLHASAEYGAGFDNAHIIKPCLGDFQGAKYGLLSKTQHDVKKQTGYNIVNKKDQNLLVLPTEAGIDIYLYWNGREYMIYYPTEIP